MYVSSTTAGNTPRQTSIALISIRTFLVGLVAISLAACSTPSFISKPSFVRTPPKAESAQVTSAVDLQVTPRELLTARLVNPPANENTPRITVGKLIEFSPIGIYPVIVLVHALLSHGNDLPATTA